jgi:LEA14-like dessication related protein
MMRSVNRFIFFILVWSLLSACATLSPNYQTPQVSITSLTLAPESTPSAPMFRIGLRVVNPNRTALSLNGMSYSVELDEHRVLTGATNDLPHIAAYDSADFTIDASPDLFGSMRLLSDLLSGQSSQMEYLFKAQLDVGRLLPLVTIEERGTFGVEAESGR